MKGRTPFWPLLKNELALGHFGAEGFWSKAYLLIFWVPFPAVLLMTLFHDDAGRGNMATVFDSGLVPFFSFFFLAALGIWSAIPAFCELGSNASPPGTPLSFGAFEFFFTRAMDRRVIFRARSAAFFLWALAPLFLSLPVSLLLPAITLNQSETPGTSERAERYRKAFPETSYDVTVLRTFSSKDLGPIRTNVLPTPEEVEKAPVKLVLPHGATAFTAWFAWNGALAFVLLQGYCSLIAKRVKPDHWKTAIFPLAPILLFLCLFVLASRSLFNTHANLYETNFLFFSTHRLAMVAVLVVAAAGIEIWCERRFSKLEVC